MAVLLGLATAAGAAAAPRVVVSQADPETGLRGQVVGEGTRIRFESQVVGGQLTSRILSRDGRTLWLYTERLGSRGEDAVFMVVGNVRFKGSYVPEVAVEMEALARSPEGALLRALAMELQVKAPAKNLVDERRGLETAYQAIQQSYPGFNQPQIFGGYDSADYLLTGHGEYVVKSQHPDTVFVANAYRGEPVGHEEAQTAASQRGGNLTPVFEGDDDHIGDDCFGMCGAGCSDFFGCGFEGWSHEWIGEPTVQTNGWSCECSRKQDGGSCGDPYGAQRFDLYGTAVHTIRGRSSVGCIDHDWCCRTFFLGCLNPLCLAMAPAALDCFFAGWPVSWSYVGPHFDVQIIYGNPDPDCYCEPCQSTERGY